MPQDYDNNDFAWTTRGDLFISHDGDIMDTYQDPLRSLYQEIRTRVMSAIGDWSIYPDQGADIEQFVGEPNNKRTAEAIKTRIIGAITKNGLVNNSDLKIKYMPIDIDKIMFRISITVLPTSLNGGSNSLGVSFLYDYSENHAYFVS